MTDKLKANSGLIAHTHEVIAKINRIEKLFIDMETGERGFIITGQEKFLEPYNNAIQKYEPQLLALRQLVSDNPGQLDRINVIDSMVIKWGEVVASPQIKVKREQNRGIKTFAEVSALVEQETGKLLMEDIRHEFNEMVIAERLLLQAREKKNQKATDRNNLFNELATIIGLIISIIAMVIVTRSMRNQIGGDPGAIAAIAKRVANGDLDVKFNESLAGETGILGALKYMVSSLQASNTESKTQNWIKAGLAQLNEIMRGDQELKDLSNKVIAEMTTYLDAQVGTLYLLSEDSELVLSGSYAYKKRKNLSDRLRLVKDWWAK